MINLLVVEDDVQLNRLFSTILMKNQYHVFSAFNGREALDVMDEHAIDLIISDIMMPDIDGYELVSSLRQAKFDTPILMITAQDSFNMMEKGFELGVDDYMIKPINVNELSLRVKALLKRAKIAIDKKLILPHTVIDSNSLTVYVDKDEIILPQKEFLLLFKLLSYPNKIFTRQQLMDDIWGLDSNTEERTIDVHINRLRDRLKKVTDFKIITVRGLGYKVVKTID